MDQRAGFELARRAYGAMAASIVPVPPGRVASFRLWHYPAAGPQCSWTVFARRPEDPASQPPLFRRLVWDRDADLERLELGGRRRPSLEPSISRLELELDEPALFALMRDAGWIRLPQPGVGPRRYRDDRPEFGLEGFDEEALDGSRSIVQLAWDRNAPLQLEAVVVWSARVRDWLRGLAP